MNGGGRVSTRGCGDWLGKARRMNLNRSIDQRCYMIE